MTGSTQVSINSGSFPRWSPDGRRLYFYNSNTIWSAEVGGAATPAASTPTFVTALPTVRPAGFFDVMPNGRILFVDGPDVGSTPELRIVLNWSAELQRLLSAP
jgi:Tol biopolymer transport system component